MKVGHRVFHWRDCVDQYQARWRVSRGTSRWGIERHHSPNTPTARCAVKGACLQRVRIPPGKGSLQPVAVGAAMEVTKSSKPSMNQDRISDSANRQAVTRVNAEQASKKVMREPTRPSHAEGRRGPGPTSRATDLGRPAGVVATACLQEETQRNTGSPGSDDTLVGCPSTSDPRGSGLGCAGWRRGS